MWSTSLLKALNCIHSLPENESGSGVRKDDEACPLGGELCAAQVSSRTARAARKLAHPRKLPPSSAGKNQILLTPSLRIQTCNITGFGAGCRSGPEQH